MGGAAACHLARDTLRDRTGDGRPPVADLRLSCSSRIVIMTTSPVNCIHGATIDLVKLGNLLQALTSSEDTALDDTDYFDPT